MPKKKLLSFIFYFLCLFSILFVFYNNYLLEYHTPKSTSRSLSLLVKTTLATKPRIFCLVVTHAGVFHTKAIATYKTWSYKCDLVRYVALIPDSLKKQNLTIKKYNGSTELELNNGMIILHPDGYTREAYSKLSIKLFATIRDIYKRYANQFDWFLKTDDDTFVFMDNLREFVEDKNISEPHTYGYNFKVMVKNGYHSGGAGYLLTKESFMRLGRKLSENSSDCGIGRNEDVDMARCLRIVNVSMAISVDELGRERFHTVNIVKSFSGPLPKWLFKYSLNKPLIGFECCSEKTITFHYTKPDMMFQMANILEMWLETHKRPITFSELVEQLKLKNPSTSPPTTTSEIL